MKLLVEQARRGAKGGRGRSYGISFWGGWAGPPAETRVGGAESVANGHRVCSAKPDGRDRSRVEWLVTRLLVVWRVVLWRSWRYWATCEPWRGGI